MGFKYYKSEVRMGEMGRKTTKVGNGRRGWSNDNRWWQSAVSIEQRPRFSEVYCSVIKDLNPDVKKQTVRDTTLYVFVTGHFVILTNKLTKIDSVVQ